MSLPHPLRATRPVLPAVLASLSLIACAASSAEPWPPAWQDGPVAANVDFTPPAFEAPSATHCRRLPSMREVPGQDAQQNAERRRLELGMTRDAARLSSAKRKAAEAESPAVAEAMGAAADRAAERSDESKSMSAPAASTHGAPPPAQVAPSPWPRSPMPQRPAHEPVTAGVVDDNADFGEYLAYRQRRGPSLRCATATSASATCWKSPTPTAAPCTTPRWPCSARVSRSR